MKHMNFGIYVMQKNENMLLPLFVEYYGNLFGYYSIHIFDNGSDDTMKPILLNASKELFTQLNIPKSKQSSLKAYCACGSQHSFGKKAFTQ